VTNAFRAWSPTQGWERLRSGVRRAGQAFGRLIRRDGRSHKDGGTRPGIFRRFGRGAG
jgi:hypothetical protein